jgi:glycosyltransferase involved in cell wall biosynthesis
MDSLPRSTISAFIVCLNEERQIRRALESVKWCDEIVVVDSGSKDATLDICREYECRIFSRPWPGYVAQKRFALEQCKMEWVLNLDADEEVSSELKTAIFNLLQNDTKKVNGYLISRVVFFLGKWWRRGCWYPEYRLRLCRRAFTKWGGTDPHEKASVEGEVRKVLGDLHHFTYDSFADQIRTLNSYSSQAARSMFVAGKKTSLRHFLINPTGRFLKCYVFKRGFLEGFAGFLVSSLEAYYVFLKYVKLWELHHERKRKDASS